VSVQTRQPETATPRKVRGMGETLSPGAVINLTQPALRVETHAFAIVASDVKASRARSDIDRPD